MLQLSLLAVTVTSSSKFSHIILQQPKDVSCGRNEQVLSVLKTTVSDMQKDVAKLSGDVAKLSVGGPQTGGEFENKSSTYAYVL